MKIHNKTTVKKGKNVCISENCVLIGDIRLGDSVSIFPGVIMRADISYIEIGKNSNIQDGTLLHVNVDMPVIVGENTTIGHGVILHGCKVGNNCLIGMGAIILDNAVIEDNCIIAAGALVKEGQNVKSGTLSAGLHEINL